MSEMNPLLDLNSVYMQEVLKPQLGKKTIAKSPEAKEGGEKGKDAKPGAPAEKRVRQAVYDIRYRARREDIPVSQAYTQYMQNTTMSGPEKSAIKSKLGEEAQVSEEVTQTKYQVRVKDKNSGKSYTRMATREKINQLRANPNISSVEMTKYGTPYEGEKKKGEQTAATKSGKGLDPVGREDKDIDNDGDHDKSDKYLLNRRKVRSAAIDKKDVKEGFSNWRMELFEVEGETEDKTMPQIKEKNIKNKVVINPEIKEAIEEIGGTLLEAVEIDEIDYLINEVYDELSEEGYEDDDIEDALEYALTEAKVTLGHDTDDEPKTSLKGKAKEFLAKAMVKGYNKARNLKKSAEPKVQRAKTSLKRKIGKVAQKVLDRVKEEVEQIDEDEYRRMLAKERQSEKEKEDKRPGFKSKNPGRLAKSTGRDYADSQMGSIKIHDKATKGKHTVGNPFPEQVEYDLEEGMDMKDFKANRKKLRRKEASADAEKRGHVGKEWYNSGRRYSPDEAKRSRAKMDDEERRTRHRSAVDPDDEDDNNYSADKTKNPKKLRKQKAMGELGEAVLGEKTLTSAETKKKEEIVKSMKKSAGDFEKRYPGRGKEVMYATATKMAKKVAEQMEDEKTQTTPTPSPLDKKKEMLDKQKLANLRMIQQKKQQLDRQKLNLQKQNKLPLNSEEVEHLDELNRAEKETGINTKTGKPTQKGGAKDDVAYTMVKKSIRKMEGTPAGQRKKVPGKKPPAAGEYGAPRSPAQKVAMRRAAAQRSQDSMHSRFD